MASSDYLKKYLSNDDEKHNKKKKKKTKLTESGMKILDDDHFITVESTVGKMHYDSEEDDTPDQVKEKLLLAEKIGFKTDGFVEIEPEPRANSPKRIQKKSSSPEPQRMKRDSDASPKRTREKSVSSSPDRSRRKRRNSDSSSKRTRKRSPSPDRRRSRKDSDASPARSSRRSPSSNHRRRRRDSDASPVRSSKRSPSPYRRRRRRDSDASPARPSRRSPSPNRRRRGKESDASPARSSRRSPSPEHKRRRRQDSDSSPIRRTQTPERRRRHAGSDASSRKRDQQQHSSAQRHRDADASSMKRRDRSRSPQRQRKRKDSDSSPKRRNGRDHSERSSGRNRSRSPKQQRKRADSDSSPVRRNDNSSRSVRRTPSPEVEKKPEVKKTLDGRKAGLVSASDMREEMEKLRQQEKEKLDALDNEAIGRDAKTNVRTKYTGRNKVKSREEEERKAREEEKNAELKKKYERWNVGVKQLQERDAKVAEDERVAGESFARHADDAAMNEYLKNSVMDEKEDPMHAIIKKKHETVQIRKGLVYPTYQGQYPPNRYNIPPGHRWDGVNRSNGFEAQLQLTANKRAADEKAAYRAVTECAE